MLSNTSNHPPQVVDKDSEVLLLPNEIAVPLQADHKHMVKFETIRSEDFDTVWKHIKKMVNSLASTTPATWGPGNKTTTGSTKDPEQRVNGVYKAPRTTGASRGGLLTRLFYAESESEIKSILDQEGLRKPAEKSPGIWYPELDRLQLTVKTLLNLAHEMDEMIARIAESEKRLR